MDVGDSGGSDGDAGVSVEEQTTQARETHECSDDGVGDWRSMQRHVLQVRIEGKQSSEEQIAVAGVAPGEYAETAAVS